MRELFRGEDLTAAAAPVEAFNLCYHQACDDLGNIDRHALEVNSDLIAFAALTFAYSTESVNGVPGKKVPGPRFTLLAPAGPEGTFAGQPLDRAHQRVGVKDRPEADRGAAEGP